MEFHKAVAGVLNQLGFQVNGIPVEAHHVVVAFTAVRIAWTSTRAANREGSAVAGLLGPAEPVNVGAAEVGAPLTEPAAAPADCGWGHRPGAPCHHRGLAPEWWPSPADEPELYLDPDGDPDDPEPVSSPPAEWPAEPPTPAVTRTMGVPGATEPLSGPHARSGEAPDRYPDPMLEPALWDAAVARGDDPDADQWPDPYFDPAEAEAIEARIRSAVAPYHNREQLRNPSSVVRPPGPTAYSATRYLRSRRAQTIDGVAVPALLSPGPQVTALIEVEIPDAIPEPDWLAETTALPEHWLAAAATPEADAAARNPAPARPQPQLWRDVATGDLITGHEPAADQPVIRVTAEEAWQYPRGV